MKFSLISDTVDCKAFVFIDDNTKGPLISKDHEILEEWNTFLLHEDTKFRAFEWKKKHYFFIKNSENSESTRVFGSHVRNALPASVNSIQIYGSEIDSIAMAEGISLSNYQFLKYLKDKEKKKYHLEEISFSASISKEKLLELTVLTDAVFWARTMVNEPVSYLTAQKFAEEIDLKCKDSEIVVKILEKTQIESLKMGGLIAVNKGSIDPPTFTILEYKNTKAKNEKPLVLVGKGVVYDTGGLSLKPTPGSMDSMKCDMAGAAMMVATIYAASKLSLPVNIIALIPASDNRPGMNAYTPGDIITMYDGTTVEILNTDAEGRLLLADALAYANKYDPVLVIDSATLTGAAVRAFGHKASCIMGNAEQHIFDTLIVAGNHTHERMVHLPFWDDFFEEMKSPIADLNNLGGGMAGMITAGKFLEHFVKAPYVHMDIAGPAWLDKKTDYKGQGGTGTGVRSLIEFIKNW